MVELRRQFQQLQQCPEWYESFDRNGSHHNSDGHSFGEDNDERNPFGNLHYRSKSEASSNESLSRQCAPRNHDFQQNQLDVKVYIPKFEGRIQPEEFINWLYSAD